MKPPTRETRDPHPTDEDRRWLVGLTTTESRARYIKRMIAYGHRRWCVVESEGELVLAVRRDVVVVIDFDDPPPAHPFLTLLAYRLTTRGAHCFVPPKLIDSPFWREKARPFFESTREIRDRRYSKLSALRGYYHERPRPGIVIPPKLIGGPEWVATLRLHDRWHAYALAYAGQKDDNR